MANENLAGIKKSVDRATLPDNFAACLADYRAHDTRLADIAAIADQEYTGSAVTPEPTVKLGGETLTKGTDYTLAYVDNTNVGTAKITITGKGDYFFAKLVTFNIVPGAGKDITTATVAAIEDQTYTGAAITPTPAVTIGETTLTKDTHYTLTYADNTAVGTGKVTVTGIAPYVGTKLVTFNIVAAGAEG